MTEKHESNNTTEDLKRRIEEARASSFSEKSGRKRTVYSELHAPRIIIEIVAGIAVGMWLGSLADSYFNTKPIFFILCVLLGVAGSVLNIYKLALNLDAQEQKSKDE